MSSSARPEPGTPLSLTTGHGTPRTLVGSFIRLLSGQTPGASREAQLAPLDIAGSEDEVSGGGFTEIPDLEEQLQLGVEHLIEIQRTSNLLWKIQRYVHLEERLMV